MIDNHLLVGITRAANTVMMVGGMAFGIAFALRLLVMSDVTIDQKFSELSMVPHDAYWVYAVAAATTPRILISASNERYNKTPGTIGMTEGIVST